MDIRLKQALESLNPVAGGVIAAFIVYPMLLVTAAILPHATSSRSTSTSHSEMCRVTITWRPDAKMDVDHVVIGGGVEDGTEWVALNCETKRSADGALQCEPLVEKGAEVAIALYRKRSGHDAGYIPFDRSEKGPGPIASSQLSVKSQDGKELPITIDASSKYARVHAPTN